VVSTVHVVTALALAKAKAKVKARMWTRIEVQARAQKLVHVGLALAQTRVVQCTAAMVTAKAVLP
jgi:hypothetical protein